MSSALSSAAMKGFADASSYDMYRPSYPQEAVDDLLAKLQIKGLKNARIVDLGAGTGKFTEILADRDEGYEVMAVEPHEQMKSQLDRKHLNGVRIVDGNATDMDLETQNNAPTSWEPRTKWEAKLKDLMWSYDDQQPRFRHEKWRQVFDKQLSGNPFTIQAADPLFTLPIGEGLVEFTHWLQPETIWERFHSLSQIAVLDGAELAKVKEKVFAALNAPDAEKNGAGELLLHGRSVYAWTSAVPGAPLKNGG
ncbi:MAG: hypothetical protein Q9183_001030 [Haloplaca sp. 2 TL-2023]